MSSIHNLIRKYGGNATDCRAEPPFLSARLAPGACELNETLSEKASRHSQGAHEHQKISVRLDNLLRLKKGDLPTEVLTALKKTLTFDNPLFLREKRFGKLPLKAQPHLFGFWEEEDDLVLARGFASELFRILNAHRIPFDLKDETRRLERWILHSQGA